MWLAYKLRWKRRQLLLRAFRARRDLAVINDRTSNIRPGHVLAFLTARNEIIRLPQFLAHHRALGVDHFLIVDNASDDGTATYLADQPDVSLWRASGSYRASRFGMDWLNHLLARHGHNHWCLTVDVDELLVIPRGVGRNLRELIDWLDAHRAPALMALTIDLYPKGPPGAQQYSATQDPIKVLAWHDANGFISEVQPRLHNLWVRGGARARMFFAHDLRRAPTMNKIPLVRWNRRYAYVNSTHTLLPRRLNRLYLRHDLPTAALLHTKFLPIVVQKSAEDRIRKEHFTDPAQFDVYYDQVIADQDMWTEASCRYSGWQGLEALGLMTTGNWV